MAVQIPANACPAGFVRPTCRRYPAITAPVIIGMMAILARSRLSATDIQPMNVIYWLIRLQSLFVEAVAWLMILLIYVKKIIVQIRLCRDYARIPEITAVVMLMAEAERAVNRIRPRIMIGAVRLKKNVQLL